MKSNRWIFRLVIAVFLPLVLSNHRAISQQNPVQDDPVLAPDVGAPPVIDGIGNDPCWQKAEWQRIAQVWIPYGGSVDSTDYSGRYKVVWSSVTNLLYFLVEIHDDEFVDGYLPDQSDGAIYNFDISEVFIDENRSGGEHRYDGATSNAENAFAYHMYAACPANGETTTTCRVEDMAGTETNPRTADYSSHFPEFALHVTGNTAVREFSLIVYNDTYTDSAKEAARVQLAADKEMGLSVAYCDNDDRLESPKVRDNMFGSVSEPSPGNLHWQNADYFGRVKLTADTPSGVASDEIAGSNRVRIYPNPASSFSQLQLDNSYRGEVAVRLFNIVGQEVFRKTVSKSNRILTQKISLGSLPAGSYFLLRQMGPAIVREKFIITNK
jgi:hypothetical protein